MQARAVRVIPIAAVALVVVAGLVLAVLGHWRRGTVALAGATALAAVLRAAVPTRFVGVLAVRSRRFDVVFLAAVTGLLIAMALTIADPEV
jgi:hypothetical protein